MILLDSTILIFQLLHRPIHEGCVQNRYDANGHGGDAVSCEKSGTPISMAATSRRRQTFPKDGAICYPARPT